MAIAYVSRPSKMTIAVTTPPTTTSYMQGDTFDPTGMVVTGTRRDGSTVDVTANCTFSPSVLETSGTQTITISYGGKTTTTSVTVSEVSISITTPPTKTEYEKGDTLDLTGIVVTAMDGQRTKNVTSECTFSPADGSRLNTAGDVAITATYYGHTASTTISVAGLMGISITTPPTKTVYREYDTLDLTGIVVMADYGVSTRDVTSQCTFSPADGATLTSSSTTLTVTFLDQTTTMPITMIASTLDGTDWATIQAIGAAGTGSQYWSIGDTKSVYLSGNFAITSISGTYKVFILHFNYQNVNGVYFGGFKTSDGIDFALGDAKTLKDSRDGTKRTNINHWGTSSGNYCTNFGGWKGCDLRYDILGSTDVAPSGYGAVPVAGERVGYDATSTCATNPKSNTVMATLPSALRAVIAPWTVYTDNVGNSSNSSSNVTASIDYLPLLSEYEVFGTRTNANQYEKNYQTRMSYYANGNSPLRRNSLSLTSTSGWAWWVRSAVSSNKTQFCCVSTNGTVSNFDTRRNYGLAPAFRVA